MRFYLDSFVLDLLTEEGITCYRIGNVEDVIKGQVNPKLKAKRFDAERFSVGFEIGSPNDFHSLGEAVLVNNQLFATSTDKSSMDYGKLISGNEFVTSGLFILPKNSQASFHLTVSSEDGIPLYDFYQRLYEKVKRPIAFSGFVAFNHFHANHIEAPPILGLNIFENKSVYYTRPSILKNREYGFIVGAVTDYSDTTYQKLNKELQAVLYKNPNESNSPLFFHAHIVTLEKECIQEHQITKNTSNQVLHLFADKSMITSADLNIYIINQVKELP
jgi:hypothetical protein